MPAYTGSSGGCGSVRQLDAYHVAGTDQAAGHYDPHDAGLLNLCPALRPTATTMPMGCCSLISALQFGKVFLPELQRAAQFRGTLRILLAPPQFDAPDLAGYRL